MEDLRIIITTFQRAESLGNLVRALRTFFDGEIWIFDDGSGAVWKPKYEAALEGMNVKYTQAAANAGHANWWRFIDRIFKLIEPDLKWALFLQDDILPKNENLITDLFHVWNGIADEQKIALCPELTPRVYRGMWHSGIPEKVDGAWRTNWLDMFFLAPREFFEVLDWTIYPCRPRTRGMSTGVGYQITTRLRDAGRTIYHVDKSLIDNELVSSVMYPGMTRSPFIRTI